MTDNLVILESMWRGAAHAGKPAPSWFPISPSNHSGRVLHKLLGPVTRVLVTNACPLVQATANHHGEPCHRTLAKNVGTFPHDIRWLLVCGQVAQATLLQAFEQNPELSPYRELKMKLAAGYKYPHAIANQPPISVRTMMLFMPHPAARLWSNALVSTVRNFIASGEVGGDLDTGSEICGMAGAVTYRFAPIPAINLCPIQRAWRLDLWRKV